MCFKARRERSGMTSLAGEANSGEACHPHFSKMHDMAVVNRVKSGSLPSALRQLI
jgi:hypothetical protein